MKCARCMGKGYIEPRDGKKLSCPRCDGLGEHRKPLKPTPTADKDMSAVWQPGYEFDFEVGTWVKVPD
jgi:RecJ-like exonuclease